MPDSTLPDSALLSDAKRRLRAQLRQRRRKAVEGLPDQMRSLVFHRPPTPVVAQLPRGGVLGLYHAVGAEAPTLGYAKWFQENGWTLALPWFANHGRASTGTTMRFRQWREPWSEMLPNGPHTTPQPADTAPELVPDVVFVPLLGFTEAGARLGQGGGHYDRWLAAHPRARAIGLAWDCQLAEALPIEPHDRPLDAVITPTRLYQCSPPCPNGALGPA